MRCLARTYKDVTGGGMAFFDWRGFAGHTAAATAGPGRAWIVGVDGDTASHDRFGGDSGLPV